MVKIILHIVFIVLFIALCIFAIWSFAGGDTGEIIRLRTEIDKLGKQNKQFEQINNGLEESVGELQKERNGLEANNKRLEGIIAEISRATDGAGEDIQYALARIRELKELSKKIGD